MELEDSVPFLQVPLTDFILRRNPVLNVPRRLFKIEFIAVLPVPRSARCDADPL
jgi:hypothetical protein